MAEALKYDKSKDLIKGEALLVFLEDKPIAYAKSHDFSLTPTMEDVSSKFSGKYKESVLGDVDWKISVDAMVSVTKGHYSANMLRQIAAAGTPVEMKIAEFSIKDTKGVKEITIGAIKYQGMVTVGEVNEKSARGEYGTVSTTLNGSGALKDAAGNEVGSAEAAAALKVG